MGPQDKDDKSVRLLNRVIEWTDEGIKYEADQRHGELIIKDMGFEGNSNSVSTPGGKKSEDHIGIKLDRQRASIYRANVARANYLSPDRPDIQYTVKEVCRLMSRLTARAFEMLKRIGRYLITKPRAMIEFK